MDGEEEEEWLYILANDKNKIIYYNRYFINKNTESFNITVQVLSLHIRSEQKLEVWTTITKL